MATVNSSLVPLSIFLTTSLMAFVSSEFGASPLPRLHTAVTHTQTRPPSDDDSAFRVPQNSSANLSLHSAERDIDGDETEDVRLETSDAPGGDFSGQAVMLLTILATFVFFGAKFVNFVLLPITTIIIMIVLIIFRRS